ncbi:MAG: ABC transporter ATP-binding protein [Thermoanaerobaculia bacterium]|nr:ABC transporter ATP-binding protein [Thermoanaerobaculia bacterium]
MPTSNPTLAEEHRLTFRGLHRRFGRLRVLQGISGEVTRGQILLVTGGNGSGKSTLLRCLAGLMRPQKGTIECVVDDVDLDVEERRRAVGFLSPAVELYGELSTAENLDFFARLRGLAPERGRQLLQSVGLPPDRAASVLSSGMTQRLRWCWALLHSPRILLLDEPLQNLDDAGARDVLGLLDAALENAAAVVANPGPLDLPRPHERLDLGDGFLVQELRAQTNEEPRSA